jgi:hypothetical protein
MNFVNGNWILVIVILLSGLQVPGRSPSLISQVAEPSVVEMLVRSFDELFIFLVT